MKVLLDECIPFPVKNYLEESGYFTEHVKQTSLEGIRNSILYESAKNNYNIFITNDKHFKHPLLFPPPIPLVFFLSGSPLTTPVFLFKVFQTYYAKRRLRILLARRLLFEEMTLRFYNTYSFHAK
jgi:predicted nuclease of predicted toxin-antitoxin system